METPRRRKPLRNGARLDIAPFYFITVTAKNRQPVFGTLAEGTVQLSETGRIADACRRKIPEIYAFIDLYAYIVMPDHVHGLLALRKGARYEKSISTIMQSYKEAVTKSARKNQLIGAEPLWQRSFYAHGFWDAAEFDSREQYIRENPIITSRRMNKSR